MVSKKPSQSAHSKSRKGDHGSNNTPIGTQGVKVQKERKVPKSYKKDTLSIRQRRVLEKTVEKGGTAKSKKEILKEAGYSEAIQGTPSKVFGSKAFLTAFNRHFTDDFLMKKHKQIIDARKIDTRDYHDWDHEEYDADPQSIEEEIQADLEDRFPGAKLVNVRKLSKGGTGDNKEYLSVKFSIPDYTVQDKSLEKAYKIKGAYAPEKHDVGFSLLDLLKK